MVCIHNEVQSRGFVTAHEHDLLQIIGCANLCPGQSHCTIQRLGNAEIAQFHTPLLREEHILVYWGENVWRKAKLKILWLNAKTCDFKSRCKICLSWQCFKAKQIWTKTFITWSTFKYRPDLYQREKIWSRYSVNRSVLQRTFCVLVSFGKGLLHWHSSLQCKICHFLWRQKCRQ